MKERYVVDTNVLIAASAADPLCPKAIDATPEDPALRMKVWLWLDEFQSSDSRLVLDYASEIYEEYCKKLDHGDFGRQVVMHKWSTACVDNVEVQFDADGHGLLSPPLDMVVHDNADRKMVAAAVGIRDNFGDAWVAFAGDTDWHDWEASLSENGIQLEPIIEEWSRAKHAEKAGK